MNVLQDLLFTLFSFVSDVDQFSVSSDFEDWSFSCNFFLSGFCCINFFLGVLFSVFLSVFVVLDGWC